MVFKCADFAFHPDIHKIIFYLTTDLTRKPGNRHRFSVHLRLSTGFF